MIYTDRKYLSILELEEDRDYVTYDELIHLLTERPSDAVYIERDETLCGLLTFGDIDRNRDEETRHVPFNKKFTCVHSEEHWRARQIFRGKRNINALPVVSEDGRLLGGYVRWNDLFDMDYAELLYKDPYVLQSLKENIQNTALVEPTVRGGAKNDEMFLYWRQKLESDGIHLQVIQHGEIKDSNKETFLFIDEDEKRGAQVLNQFLCCGPCNKTKRLYCTITDFYRMRQISSGHRNTFILKAVQDQGVSVLVFDFMENKNQFLAVLSERIRKRDEEYGVHPGGSVPEELIESFADELYCETYKTQNFPLKASFHRRLGIPYLSDMETEFFHIRNGERLTANQPEKYDRCICLYGPCNILGKYVSDQYTIPSLLQGEIDQAGFSCKVINRGFLGGKHAFLNTERLLLQAGSFKRGDIVVLDGFGSFVENFPILNLTDALEKHDAPADWFTDNPRHCNHKANQVYAHAIYEELVPVLQQPSGDRTPVELDFDHIDHFYVSRYFSDFDHTSHGTIGAIVMNCNPFTLGHRFLIEEALKTVDFLIIFVVEEDESFFPFQERFAMVYQGTSDLERVMVVPSGPYILSKNTFPEYFQKINDEDLKKNTEDDIMLFAEKIAPKLGITYRFVGEEREDEVTNEYNEAMKRILPLYGIQVVEIPRKANGQSVISASRVRHCLAMNHMEELDELVPASTKRILFYENK